MMILNTTDTKGRAVWLCTNRSELSRCSHELTAKGERYRIVSRTISALGASAEIFVLVILARKEGGIAPGTRAYELSQAVKARNAARDRDGQ